MPDSTKPSSQDSWPRRLDAAAARVAGVSRRQAQRLIADAMVSVNGQTASAGDKGRPVTAWDKVLVCADAGRVVPQPEQPLVELARGKGWVVIDKPAGTAVHPLREGETGTTLNAVAARYPQVQGVGEAGLKSGVAHRLDVDTSGALLVALDQEHWQRFRTGFSEHRVEKKYTAVVAGNPPDTGEAQVHLAVTRHRPALVEVVAPSTPASRLCTLSWHVVERLQDTARVEINLGTGFLHQIRATFAHLGHPVLGDNVYFPHPDDRCAASRLMLHAASLRFEEISVASPLPPEFFSGAGQPPR